MPGFFISNVLIELALTNFRDCHFIGDRIRHARYTIQRSTLDKFMDDKLFYEDEDFIIITEGVFLNKKELCADSSWPVTVRTMAANQEYRYFDRFRGNFSGAHYHKGKDEWVVYTDALGMKPVFYFAQNDLWMVSSDMRYIVDALRKLGIPFTFNPQAAYEMLTYGFMLTNKTFVNEIQKLPYGCFLTIRGGRVSLSRYFDFHYSEEETDPEELSDDEIIERLDNLFTQAVSLEFEKDTEYGYDHLATLSGGLDSRMTVWTAFDCGEKNVVNLTFGESDCMDEQIAKKVACRLGNELIIKTLDDGGMLKAYEPVVKMNLGLSLYSGISHTYTTLKQINFEGYGLLHTGDVGDAIVGSFAGANEGPHPGAYSLKLADKLTDDWDGVQNVEKFKMITRAFNGVGASKIVCENYVYCISPFLYRDFFEFCLQKIPKSKRDGHYIYKKWVLQKHPDAAKIPLQRYNNGLMTEGKLLQTLRKMKRIGAGKLLEWLLWKIGIKKEMSRRTVKSSMNPLDTWFAEKEDIRKQMDAYFESGVQALCAMPGVSEELIEDMSGLYHTGTVSEKTQVITVLAAIQELF